MLIKTLYASTAPVFLVSLLLLAKLEQPYVSSVGLSEADFFVLVNQKQRIRIRIGALRQPGAVYDSA